MSDQVLMMPMTGLPTQSSRRVAHLHRARAMAEGAQIVGREPARAAELIGVFVVVAHLIPLGTTPDRNGHDRRRLRRDPSRMSPSGASAGVPTARRNIAHSRKSGDSSHARCCLMSIGRPAMVGATTSRRASGVDAAATPIVREDA